MTDPTTTAAAGSGAPGSGRGLTRRATLLRLAGLAATAAGGGALALERAAPAAAGPNAVSAGLLSCVLTPELTEGPYWIAGDKVRRDITEGRPGTPLLLRATVLDVATCKPVGNAAVDIWHCDAGGTYSGFSSLSEAANGGGGGLPGDGQGGGPGGSAGVTDKKRFLRGIQRTQSTGVVEFATIYPGWYQGRTVHIHVKVWSGGNVVHTGQLFFPDDLTDAVYKVAPYASRGARSTRNANDSIYVNGGSKSVVKLTKAAKGWVATVTMGVHAE
jgi:protocatechuate 3,4-dioxygenase beta subunit